ncbi:MAG TPA: FHA domain-containing protein [Ktedonobacteraceae bacterium]|nr:FHA domain-containing protein [Ktedonobacteraceae bacterium]
MEASLSSPLGRINLIPAVLTIGRAPDNQLALQDQQASSHHAEIRPGAQGYLLVDLNSRNGTFVNEQRLEPQTPRLLASGDVIRIGATSLTYEIADSYDATDATIRAGSGEYVNPGYAPTIAVPPMSSPPGYTPASQPDYASYQQPPPSFPNYPQAEQPGYQQAFPQPQPGYPQQPPQSFPQQQGYPQSQPGYPQQPWAGAPGQFGGPGAAVAAQPKKRRTGLVIGIVVLLVIIVGAIGGYIFLNRSTPEKTLQAYCTALENNDAQGLFNLESTNAKQHNTLNSIKLGLAVINTPLGGNGVKNCVASPVTNNNGTTADGTVTVTLGNGKTLTSSGVLVNENGTWKLGDTQQAP